MANHTLSVQSASTLTIDRIPSVGDYTCDGHEWNLIFEPVSIDWEAKYRSEVEAHSQTKATLNTLRFALDQSNADRDFYQEGQQTTENRNAEFESQLEIKDKRIKWLEKEVLQSRKQNKWTDDVLFHPNIQQARDRALLIDLTKRTDRVAPGPDGKYRVNSGELTASTNLKKGAILEGMISLKGMGIDIETEDIPGKGNRKRYVYAISQEIKDDPRKAIRPEDEKSNYGGTREVVLCPNCGSSKNAHSKRNKCADCSHEWGAPWKANNIDLAAQAQEAMKEEAPPPSDDIPEEELRQHMTTLFPDEEKPKAKKSPDGRPPKPICPKCAVPKDGWEETFEYWFCTVCTGGKT